MLSSLEGGYLRIRKLGREATPGKPRMRKIEDRAYKRLGDTVPPHSRADSTTPSACYALRNFNGCCNQFHFISFHFNLHTVQKCLVVLELFVQNLGVDRLGNEIPGLCLAERVITSCGEW